MYLLSILQGLGSVVMGSKERHREISSSFCCLCFCHGLSHTLSQLSSAFPASVKSDLLRAPMRGRRGAEMGMKQIPGP